MPRPHPTTVGHLKRLLADVLDDTPILVPAPDHSYESAVVRLRTALLYPRPPGWAEDAGDLSPNVGDGPWQGKRHQVVVVYGPNDVGTRG